MTHTFVQEIVVAVSDSSRFIAYISNTQGSSQFDLELLFRDPNAALTHVCVPQVHAAAQVAFIEAIDTVKQYLSKTAANVATIDSPCNAPFIDKAGQAAVLRRKGINVAPTVNGK